MRGTDSEARRRSQIQCGGSDRHKPGTWMALAFSFSCCTVRNSTFLDSGLPLSCENGGGPEKITVLDLFHQSSETALAALFRVISAREIASLIRPMNSMGSTSAFFRSMMDRARLSVESGTKP